VGGRPLGYFVVLPRGSAATCKAPFLFWSLGIDYRVERGNGVLEFQEEVYLPLGLARLVTSRQRFNGQPAVTNKLASGFLRCRGVIFCHE
jgi:hypothetical protein